MKNNLEKLKKSGCSPCKSENPLYKKIPSENNLLIPMEKKNSLPKNFSEIVGKFNRKVYFVISLESQGEVESKRGF